jgi:hypothetical protein
MTREITAKFTSRCKACGSSINPGETIIYDPQVKYSSRHKLCPAPLNSPGRGALQGRSRSDQFLGEKTEIVLGFASEDKGHESDLGHTLKAKDGRFITCVGVASHWVSQDEADDFDLVGPGGSFERHWSLLKYYRLATPEEQAACEARIAAKENAKRFENLCNYGNDYPHGDGGRQIISSAEADALGERVRIWRKSVGHSLHEGWRVEAGLLTYHPVYDDSPYWQLIRFAVMTPADAQMIRAAQEVK